MKKPGIWSSCSKCGHQFPSPPEEAGWYAINQRADSDFADGGALVCLPEIVWYDPDDDPENFYFDGGGFQGIECVALWGTRVTGLGRERLEVDL